MRFAKSSILHVCLISFSFLSLNCDHSSQDATSEIAKDPGSAPTQVFGHRGASAFYAENSLSSVRAALLQVQGAEIDIQLTRDLIPVVLHDDTFRRTASLFPENTNIDQRLLDTPIGELLWDEVKGISIAPNGEKVPTLRDVLDELRQFPDRKLLVEIKSYGPDDQALPQKMITALDQLFQEIDQPLKNQVIFISFDDEVLTALQGSKSLQGIDRYWLLSGTQIETAVAKNELMSLLKRGQNFTGFDLESGPYLYRKLAEDKNIVSLIKEQQQKVITWISRRQRTDGVHWLRVSSSLGVDIFTSDLPVDVLFRERWQTRLEQTVAILNHHGFETNTAPLFPDRKSADLIINGQNFNLYAATGFDYQDLNPEELRRSIEVDLRYLIDQGNGVIVNISDLTNEEKTRVLDALKQTDAEIKKKALIIEPSFPQGASQKSIVNIELAKARLVETKILQSYTILNLDGVPLCQSSIPGSI